jgi:autotransporter-associated beta strand protein
VGNGNVIVANGATLQVQQINTAGSLSVARPITALGSGYTTGGASGAIQMLGGGNGANTLTGNVILIGDTTVGVDTGSLTLNTGVVSGAAGLSKAGLGYLILSGTNTYNGTTTIGTGIVETTAAQALGVITAGITVASGASLQLNGAANTVYNAKPLTLNGDGFGFLPGGGSAGLLLARGALVNIQNGAANSTVTWTGNITMNGSSTIGNTSAAGNTTLVIASIISGTNLNKVGVGAITLSASNTFTGNLTVSAGTLNLANKNANSGAITVAAADGGTSNLTLSSFGTILSTSSPITVGVGATLLVDNSGTLLVNRIADTTSITLNGAILQFNANNSINVTTTETVGTITLASGQSTIQAGFTATAVAGATSVLTSTGLTRSPGATVNFIGGTSNASPLGTSSNQLVFNNLVTAVTLTGTTTGGTSSATYTGLSTSGLGLANGMAVTGQGVPSGWTITSFTANSITIGGSGSAPAASGVYLTFAAGVNASLQYVGNQGNILPYAEVNGGNNAGDFATYTTSGVAPFSNYATQAFGGNTTLSATAGDIVKVIAQGGSGFALTAATNLSVGALLVQNLITVASQTVNIIIPSSMTLSSGLLMFQGPGTGTNNGQGIIGGQINLGGEGVVFNNFVNNGTGTAVINSVLAGGGGLTLGGSGQTLALPNPNIYTGTTTLNAGTASLGSASAFGNSGISSSLVLTGGTLQGTAALTFPSTVALTLNSANVTFGGTVPVTFAGTTTAVGNSTLTFSDTAGTFFTGKLTGGGGLVIAGAQPVFLTNTSANNDYSGGTVIAQTAATTDGVILGDSNALGSGTIAFNNNGAQLIANAASSLSFTNNVVINSNVTFTGSQSITFSNTTFTNNAAPVLLTNASTITVSNPNTTFSGAIGEAGAARALTVAGLGTLTLSGANTYSNGTTLNMVTAGVGTGILAISTGSTLTSPSTTNPLFASSIGSGTLTVNNGGDLNNAFTGGLTLNNVITVGGSSTLGLAGNAFTLTGNVAIANALTLSWPIRRP